MLTLATASRKTTATCLLGAIFMLFISSCGKQSDPSYEKELLRLTAEKAILETKLQAAEKENQKMTATISEFKSAAAKTTQNNSIATSKKLQELEAARTKRDNDLAALRNEIAELRKIAARTPTPTPVPPVKPTPPKNNEWKVQVDRNAGSQTNQRSAPNRSRAPVDPNTHKIDWNKAK